MKQFYLGYTQFIIFEKNMLVESKCLRFKYHGLGNILATLETVITNATK